MTDAIVLRCGASFVVSFFLFSFFLVFELLLTHSLVCQIALIMYT